MRKLLAHLLAGALLFGPSVASAQISNEVPHTIGGLVNVVCRLANWFFALLVVAAVIVFLRAGAEFFLGGGNEQSQQRARRFLQYGIIGLVLAVLSRSFVLLIGRLLGVSTATMLNYLTNPKGACAEQ